MIREAWCMIIPAHASRITVQPGPQTIERLRANNSLDIAGLPIRPFRGGLAVRLAGGLENRVTLSRYSCSGKIDLEEHGVRLWINQPHRANDCIIYSSSWNGG